MDYARVAGHYDRSGVLEGETAVFRDLEQHLFDECTSSLEDANFAWEWADGRLEVSDPRLIRFLQLGGVEMSVHRHPREFVCGYLGKDECSAREPVPGNQFTSNLTNAVYGAGFGVGNVDGTKLILNEAVDDEPDHDPKIDPAWDDVPSDAEMDDGPDDRSCFFTDIDGGGYDLRPRRERQPPTSLPCKVAPLARTLMLAFGSRPAPPIAI